MRECVQCHAQLEQVTGRGRPAKYCSDACRELAWGRRLPIRRALPALSLGKYPRQITHGVKYSYEYLGCRCEACTTAARAAWRKKKHDLTCATCAKAIPLGPQSLPQGQATCRGCRKAMMAEVRTRRTIACESCSFAFVPVGKQRFCSRGCANRSAGPSRRIRPIDDPRSSRRERERQAVGLSATQRDNLRAKWRTQRRTCAYCPSLGSTVDHVVPLVRGGTNHEGNLVPCCKSCNSSKGGLLIVEWDSRRRHRGAGGRIAA